MYSVTYLPAKEYFDPEARAAIGWQTGVYHISGLRIERLLAICDLSGESYDQVILHTAERGMTDTTFVFVMD